SASGNGFPLGSQVNWNLGSLAAGQSGSVTLQVRVGINAPNGTPLINSARISSNEVPGGVVSNSVTTTVTQPSQLTVQKTASVSTGAPGGQVDYQITVTNSGSQATGVTLTDPIPAGATGVFAFNGGPIINGLA